LFGPATTGIAGTASYGALAAVGGSFSKTVEPKFDTTSNVLMQSLIKSMATSYQSLAEGLTQSQMKEEADNVLSVKHDDSIVNKICNRSP
tara:strand:+ start:712 stop:981 length:270 start_codon:yes stop_codon:yes gene_type:complete